MDSEGILNDESQPIEGASSLEYLNLPTNYFPQSIQISDPYLLGPHLRNGTQSTYPSYCISPSHMNPTMYPTTYSVTPPNPNAYFSPTEEPLSYESLFSNQELTTQEPNQAQRSYENIIAQEYKKMYGDIIHAFKANINGYFRNLIVALMTPLHILEVIELHRALLSYDFYIVTEIICTLSNENLSNLKTKFEMIYGKSLDMFIQTRTSKCCKNFLLEICKCMRDESNVLNYGQAEQDARLLCALFKDPNNYFVEIFSKRSFPQIKLTCKIYEELFLHSIDSKIKNIFSFYDQQGYLVVTRFACNEQEYYAKRLRQSMKGLGTNNEQLIRIIVTRSEIDLGDIKKTFHRLFNGTLKEWIEDDTSGHYKDALLTLIGEY